MEIKDFEQFEKKLKTFTGFMSEPQIKYFDSGAIKTTFSIPLKKNKEDKPIYLNCLCWGKMAEKVAEYEKGFLVSVQGYFEENEKDGKKYLNFVVLFIG